MMKRSFVLFFITAAGLLGSAWAQGAQKRSSSTKPSSDPVLAATQPLTPKSAMPTKKKSLVIPGAAGTGRNATAELTHLERQNVQPRDSKSGKPERAKVASSAKPATTTDSGSKINFKYEKPVGGLTASQPGADSKNSGTPRVKKN